MKKIVTLIAVVFAVSCVNAASVAWSTGAIKVPLAGGTFGANVGTTTGIYLATVAFYLDNAGELGAAIAGVTGTTDTTTSVATGSVLNGTGATYSFGNNASYWAQVVVTSTDGNWIMTSTVARFTLPGTGNGSVNFLTGSGFNTIANKMPTEWTAVPEPTSMALLALGVAALGLRRKFRK